jgi:hypothetical protein
MEMRPMTAAEGRQMFAAQQAMYAELIQQVYQAGVRSGTDQALSISSNPQLAAFPPSYPHSSTFQPSLPILPPLGLPASTPITPPATSLNPVNSQVLLSSPQQLPATSTPAPGRRMQPSYIAALSFSAPPVVSYVTTPIVPRPLPSSGRIIPKVPRGEHGWRTVISDWEEGDESRSLPVPLKDWPQEWYSCEAGRTLGTLYNNRRLIATEFIKQCVHPLQTR